MEFMTGVNKKDTVEISEILAGDFEGKTVKVNGAVHTIRDMGEVAFVVLRKREGLLQCVFEEGKTKFDLKDLKEAATVEVEGAVKSEDRAPNGFEIRLDSIRVLSEPAAPMPLAISKWKLNTSLEANLNNRSIALRNIRERAKFKIQEGVVRGFRDFLNEQASTEIYTPKIGAKAATSFDIFPSYFTSAKSLTRFNRRFASRGVPRERLASSNAPSSSISTPSVFAECRMIVFNSSTV